jgi:FkbM family methyltransferase
MTILGRVKNIAKKTVKRLSPDYGKDIVHQIGELKITLPYGHMLPVYQKQCPQYDRFLPHIAKYLPSHSFVVDVGANCADTLAGMIDANPLLNFLCIEADDYFYQYLTSNVCEIQKTYSNSIIKTFKSLAGSEISNVEMAGTGGTKKAVASLDSSTKTITSKSLDSIIQSQHVDQASISLIKVDTDGYDYDVINSASLLLQNKLPILFFECQHDDISQKEKYKMLIHHLAELGYNSWTVFDNFGALLLRNCDKDAILDLINYVWRQNAGTSRRTFYYLDILVGADADASLIADAIDNY